ncbi:hypothetical protein O181_082327 [Austropuccinia psidii MF-1]|uniref:Integrase zinc-binding domain-containing protein n=1 Tax=Austropuccinia psidii MF-1 TaxID=1389203 RepID=A0A9Q3FSC1_9BASI|nr:hypothetical protein [Austropuccinia psidii MF-1]
MSSKVLTCCQAHWAELLSEFHFSTTYCPGYLATLLDALSHWDHVYLERGEDLISKNPMNFKQIIKQDEIQPSRYFAVNVEYFSNLIDSIHKALWQDSQYRSILQELGKGKSIQDYSLDSSSQLLFFKDQVVVPNDPTIKLSILQKGHDSPLAGHPGQEKTLKLVKRDFHWCSMTQFIMLLLLKASRWTKKNSIRFSICHLQETSRLFNHSLASPTSTAASSRIIQRRSVHSPVSSRKIPVSPSIRKLLVSFTNSKTPSPLLQFFSTHHCRDRCIRLCFECCTESGL